MRLRSLPVWLVPAGLTLVVTLVGLDGAQPWRDELATWSAATRGLGGLLRLAGTIDAATGPYYLLMHAWVAVAGDSATALRLPSALATTAAAGLTAVLGRRLWDARVGTLAGLLFAVLPGTSRYGQEARPYALATALAVLSTLLLVDALRHPGRRRWVGYAAATTALGLTHLVALTLIAAHAVAVLATATRRTTPAGGSDSSTTKHHATPANGPDGSTVRHHATRAGGPPTGATDGSTTKHHATPAGAPNGSAARHHAAPAGGPDDSTARHDAAPADDTQAGATAGGTEPGGGERGPPGGRTVWCWLAALVPVAVAVTPLALVAQGQRARQLDWVDAARPSDLATLAGGVTQSGVVGGLLVGLAALGAVRAGRRGLLPASCVLLPVLLLFLAGLVVPLWVPRYLVFVVPFGCLLAGVALASARLPAALVVVALAGLLGLPDQAALRRTHEWPRSAMVDYRAVARTVADGQRPGDAVVYSPRESWLFLDLGLGYHLGGRTPRDVLLVEGQARRGDLWATECDRPAECLAGTDRVWLVLDGRHPDPLAAVPGAKGDALRASFTATQTWPHPGLTLTLLTRPTP
ncbi:glycosyltransferase family 39 protein [Micromonospora sp. WMMD1082]|nr:glycosyltransferase family 39 protein [Micromonospora sp. WMMD1082]MDG4793788.1 glycosyltransferase family 39 protein [Micromonospora sp. WMMD1082]